MKHYLLALFTDEEYDAGINIKEITQPVLFDDFDTAFNALCNYIYTNHPAAEPPKQPKRPCAFNFSYRGNHYQIWETNIPQIESHV